LALAGMLVLGVSGAITALGDTLFPVTTLAEGEAMTFSGAAHAFVRLRVWHPVLALVVGTLVVGAAVHAARTRRDATVVLLARALVGVFALNLMVGVLNVWWLAPLPLQLVHLLLADLVWIALVVLAASAAAAPAVQRPSGWGTPPGGRGWGRPRDSTRTGSPSCCRPAGCSGGSRRGGARS